MLTAFFHQSRSRRVYVKGIHGGSACRPAPERQAWILEQLSCERRVTLDAYRAATGASRAAIFRDLRSLRPEVRERIQPDRTVKAEWVLA
jgi:hypothetical protein